MKTHNKRNELEWNFNKDNKNLTVFLKSWASHKEGRKGEIGEFYSKILNIPTIFHFLLFF